MKRQSNPPPPPRTATVSTSKAVAVRKPSIPPLISPLKAVNRKLTAPSPSKAGTRKLMPLSGPVPSLKAVLTPLTPLVPLTPTSTPPTKRNENEYPSPGSVEAGNIAVECYPRCKGLEECKYPHHRGYSTAISRRNDTEVLVECPYLGRWKVSRRQDNLLAGSGIPLPYQHLNFEGGPIRDGRVLRQARELSSVYVWGPPSSGKTALLCLIGNEHIKRGRSVKYTTTSEMLLKLRYTSEHCEEQLNRYLRVGVLLVDELGQERLNDYTEEQLYMVMNGRLREGRITVVSSRLSVEEAVRQYGRLRERLQRLSERTLHLSK